MKQKNEPRPFAGKIACPFVRMAHERSFKDHEPEMTFSARRLLDYELIYITEGCITIHLTDKQEQVKKGGLILLQPALRHAFTFTAGHNYYLHFDLIYNPFREKSFIKTAGQAVLERADYSLLQPALTPPAFPTLPLYVYPEEPQRMKELFRDCLRLYQETPPFWEWRIQERLLSLLTCFFDAAVPSKKGTEQGLSMEARLDRVSLFIRSHLNIALELSELARFACLSPYHLCRMFKQQFGMGPIRYHTHLRIQEAKRRIERSMGSIKEVAFDLGFDSPFSFSRAFKRETGKAPTFCKPSKSERN